jgi:hypothetical protein
VQVDEELVGAEQVPQTGAANSFGRSMLLRGGRAPSRCGSV